MHPERVPKICKCSLLKEIQSAHLSKNNSTQLPEDSHGHNKEQTLVDICWSGTAVRDKLRSKFIKTTERNKKIFPQSSSVVCSARVSNPMTPSSNSKARKSHRMPIMMVEESVKPTAFKYRNRSNLLGNNAKTMRTVNKTAFEAYNNRTKGRNIISPIQNSSIMQSFSASRRHDCTNLREQLQKITFDLDTTLNRPQKARRTRKERKLNTIGNNSRNDKTLLIQNNGSLNTMEAKSNLKCVNKKQLTRNSLNNNLENRSNTAREKVGNKLSTKENTKLISAPKDNLKLNKIVPVHRRCFTRMIQLNSKEEKKKILLTDKQATLKTCGKETGKQSNVCKKGIQSKQLCKAH